MILFYIRFFCDTSHLNRIELYCSVLIFILQDRVTDHRVPITVFGVESVLAGTNLFSLTDALSAHDEKDRLSRFLAEIAAGTSS
jgi:hypothetical protein